MDKEFDKKLAEKIKEEKLAPKPRWHFLLKDYVVWASGTLSLLIGAATVSVMIYLLKYNGWELREETHKSFLEFLILTLPYFWIIFSGLFIFILYYNLKHTKKGYRYPVWAIVMSGFFASLILGSIFYLFGVGQRIDNVLGARAPMYEKVMNRQIPFWFNPEEGRLAGTVSSEVENESFYLVDPAGQVWQVTSRSSKDNLHMFDFFKIGEPVNIIGEIAGTYHFRADFIRPFVPGHGFFKVRGRSHCLEKECPLAPFAGQIQTNPESGIVIMEAMPQ